jgi:hypothetical protein
MTLRSETLATCDRCGATAPAHGPAVRLRWRTIRDPFGRVSAHLCQHCAAQEDRIDAARSARETPPDDERTDP